MHPFREQVLTAIWTPLGVEVTQCDLPDPWLRGLDQLSHDLRARRYGDDIEHIDWVAEYDPDGGAVWLTSSITIAGEKPGGFRGNGMGATVDADEETALVSMADLVQTEIAEVGTAWPWGDTGGFMHPTLADNVAVWTDRTGNTTRIGDLVASD
ncbi:MAG: hypothetical protein WBD41_30805 [Rhodococcus sp. (in: high G+C Gram-positive bacteria)]|uniref:hypothetical protein n=1 Tax=Rhodococcus sp. EPR-157 TaxID=1813677 RepID=UPI0007BC082F|nr:hypothetical protein [Rhodococcus sp. EPR-157]KZF05454.1 hypothetical protein A2J03_05850 [Rhodococcus sp. EPR-157]